MSATGVLPVSHPDTLLVVAVDTLVAAVHFPCATRPEDLGHKALAVNLSDLAAMGATARTADTILRQPSPDDHWFEAFESGMVALAEAHGVRIQSIDRIAGPLAVTVQVHGEVAPERALRRDAARVGEDLWVSGTLGDAGLALACLRGEIALPEAARSAALRRLNRPQPQLRLGQALAGLASAAIDISDGLIQDLGHIAEASEVGVRVRMERVPLSAALRASVSGKAARVLALAVGDDYELCFSARAAYRDRIAALAHGLCCPLTRIGAIEEGHRVRVVDGTGKSVDVPPGYQHFRGQP